MASNFASHIVGTIRSAVGICLIPLLLVMVSLWPATAAANPGTTVWWQLDSGDGAVVQSGAGQTLEITPTPGSFAHLYNFSMWIANDAAVGTGGLTRYFNNIWRGPDHDMTMISDPMEGLLNPLGWTGPAGYTAGSVNDGDFLIANYGRARASGGQTIWAGNSPLKVITITIQITGPTSPHYIYQTVGASLYGWNPPVPPTLNQVAFSPNPFVYGGTAVMTWPDAAGTLPVIAIIPEPATPALLGFVLVAMTRTRRAK
jgi:hypothetical protein